MQTLEISTDNESELFQIISDLSPYTAYTVYIQCGFADCVGGWGMFSKPITVRTNEEGKELYYFLDMFAKFDVSIKKLLSVFVSFSARKGSGVYKLFVFQNITW